MHQTFFKPTAFKVIVAAIFIATHLTGNLLYNRSLYSVDGKLFSNADFATRIMYAAPNLVVAPLLPLRNSLNATEKMVQNRFAFVFYTMAYVLYLYALGCCIALPIEQRKKGRPGSTR